MAFSLKLRSFWRTGPGLLLAGVGLSWAAEGSGQTETEVPEAASPAALERPRLLESVAPEYPPEALAAREEGRVVLRLTLDAEGQLTDAVIAESAGPHLDGVALAAARRLRFSPARRGGKAIRARILHAFEFRLPAPVTDAVPVEPVDAPAPQARPEPLPLRRPLATPPPIEVTVEGLSEVEQLRRSAEAVQIVETARAKLQSQDLGEVLARTRGVAVQRSSGLGSDTRISLNGLTDDQIRFFLDGIPLHVMGYPLGLANVPVNLVERIEVYRGVVPVRFGADALGGAVNLVSDPHLKPGLHGAASYQVGSFGTYRATANAQHFDAERGRFARAGGFLDLTRNDYPMSVTVPDAAGTEVPARVHRFHDGYQALGANVEVGVVNRSWAERLSLRGFATVYDKEVPHNLVMSFNPYGDITYGKDSYGAVARYDNLYAGAVQLRAVVGYTYAQTSYTDLGECVYDWSGRCIRTRAQPGERIGRAQDQDYFEHNLYGRVNVAWSLREGQALQLSVSPTYVSQSGIEHRMANPAARDPLSAERKLGGFVTGLEYDSDWFDKRLAHQLFVKSYLQRQSSEEPLSNGVDFRRRDRTTHRFGVGDSLRYSFYGWLYAKASYEWATRLPRADEVFGNAFPVQANLGLLPERSHNANLALTLDAQSTPLGALRAEVNGFLREIDALIRLVGDDDSASYKNVRDARSLGLEGALGWSSPKKYLSLDANATYVDFRNTSTTGPDANYNGDRIPNRPYLFSTGSARFQLSHVALPRDELSVTWTSRYVHSFLRGWESIGTDKPFVPAQLLHSLVLVWAMRRGGTDIGCSAEVQNLSDARAFDYFGVPKPGRAFYFKTTLAY